MEENCNRNDPVVELSDTVVEQEQFLVEETQTQEETCNNESPEVEG